MVARGGIEPPTQGFSSHLILQFYHRAKANSIYKTSIPIPLQLSHSLMVYRIVEDFKQQQALTVNQIHDLLLLDE
jgi:hypothetical protein